MDLTPKHATLWRSLFTCCRPPTLSRAEDKDAAAATTEKTAAQEVDALRSPSPTTVSTEDSADVSEDLIGASVSYVAEDGYDDDDDMPDMSEAHDEETYQPAQKKPEVRVDQFLALLMLRAAADGRRRPFARRASTVPVWGAEYATAPPVMGSGVMKMATMV